MVAAFARLPGGSVLGQSGPLGDWAPRPHESGVARWLGCEVAQWLRPSRPRQLSHDAAGQRRYYAAARPASLVYRVGLPGYGIAARRRAEGRVASLNESPRKISRQPLAHDQTWSQANDANAGVTCASGRGPTAGSHQGPWRKCRARWEDTLDTRVEGGRPLPPLYVLKALTGDRTYLVFRSKEAPQ